MKNSKIALYECKSKQELWLVTDLLLRVGIEIGGWNGIEDFVDYIWQCGYRFIGASRNSVNAWKNTKDGNFIVVNSIGGLINFYLNKERKITVNMGQGLEFLVSNSTIEWQGKSFDIAKFLADLSQAQKEAAKG